VPAELVSGTASELNDLLATGALQVSAVSAVEYARNAALYHLLPDLAITCDGPVHSVALFSKRPVSELTGCTVLLSASSRTSVLLLELLSRHRWGIRPRFATARAEAPDLVHLAGLPHEAVLVIGDAALHLSTLSTYPVRVDLGAEWKRWTGLPFVFAVWAARREADPATVARVRAALLASRAWGLAHLGALAAAAHETTGVPLAQCLAYLDGLDYALSGRHQAGLTTFFRTLAAHGLAPAASLRYLQVA
jgi:chorismate dehydratase